MGDILTIALSFLAVSAGVALIVSNAVGTGLWEKALPIIIEILRCPTCLAFWLALFGGIGIGAIFGIPFIPLLIIAIVFAFLSRTIEVWLGLLMAAWVQKTNKAWSKFRDRHFERPLAAIVEDKELELKREKENAEQRKRINQLNEEIENEKKK